MHEDLKNGNLTEQEVLLNAKVEDGEQVVTCTHGGKAYSVGEEECINKLMMKCGTTGQWFKTGKSC